MAPLFPCGRHKEILEVLCLSHLRQGFYILRLSRKSTWYFLENFTIDVSKAQKVPLSLLQHHSFFLYFLGLFPPLTQNYREMCFQDTLHQSLSYTFNSIVFQQFVIHFLLHRSPPWLSDIKGDSKVRNLTASPLDLE